MADLTDKDFMDSWNNAGKAEIADTEFMENWNKTGSPAAQEPSGLFRRAVSDPAISALKGAIGLPEAGVGLLDIPTLGLAGKAAKGLGIDFKGSKEYLDTLYSPEQQEANKAVQDAQGFIPTVVESLKKPSTIAHSVIESFPSMIGGASIGRGLMKVLPKLSGIAAAGLGEGAISTGQTAEQTRQESVTGMLTPLQAGVSTVSGLTTGMLGIIGGKLAKRLGWEDIDVLMTTGKTAAEKSGVLKKIIAGAISEGAFEELPQSAQEQMAQNINLGKPAMEGVAEAAAQGMLAGFVMGGGGNVASHVMGKLQTDPTQMEIDKQMGSLPAELDMVKPPEGQGVGLPVMKEETAPTLLAPQTQEVLSPTAKESVSAAPIPNVEERRGKARPETQGERRKDTETRKRISEMSVEEARVELGTDHLTRLANKRAYEEKERKPIQASLDVDGLKMVNDTYGHEAGNSLLKAVGVSLKNSGLPDVYHFHGDEFYAEGNTREEVTQAMDKAKEYLKSNPLTFTDKSGASHSVNIGFSYGIGATQAEAETGLQTSKASRLKSGEVSAKALRIDAANRKAATSPENPLPEPTEAQKAAGNYKKGHPDPKDVQGLNLSIENPKGSVRKGKDENGKPWETLLVNDYGHVLGTKAKDGDPIDIFIGPNPESPNIFVVNQKDPKTGKFDEPKTMFGFNTQVEAQAGYLANYDKSGPSRIKSIIPMSIDQFKEWTKSNGGDVSKELTKTPKILAAGDAAVRQKLVEKAATKATHKLTRKMFQGLADAGRITSDLHAEVKNIIDILEKRGLNIPIKHDPTATHVELEGVKFPLIIDANTAEGESFLVAQGWEPAQIAEAKKGDKNDTRIRAHNRRYYDRDSGSLIRQEIILYDTALPIHAREELVHALQATGDFTIGSIPEGVTQRAHEEHHAAGILAQMDRGKSIDDIISEAKKPKPKFKGSESESLFAIAINRSRAGITREEARTVAAMRKGLNNHPVLEVAAKGLDPGELKAWNEIRKLAGGQWFTDHNVKAVFGSEKVLERMRQVIRAYRMFDAKEMMAISRAGQGGLGWYENSRRFIQQLFPIETHPYEHRMFAQLLAGTSAGEKPGENLAIALRAWVAWEKKGRTNSPSKLAEIFTKAFPAGHLGQQEKIKSLLAGGYLGEKGGFKQPFYSLNIRGFLEFFTSDLWIARQIGNELVVNNRKVTNANGAIQYADEVSGMLDNPMYLAMSARSNQIAKKLGLPVASVQETMWSFTRALYDAINPDTKNNTMDLFYTGSQAQAALESLTHEDVWAQEDYLPVAQAAIEKKEGKLYEAIRQFDSYFSGRGQKGLSRGDIRGLQDARKTKENIPILPGQDKRDQELLRRFADRQAYIKTLKQAQDKFAYDKKVGKDTGSPTLKLPKESTSASLFAIETKKDVDKDVKEKYNVSKIYQMVTANPDGFTIDITTGDTVKAGWAVSPAKETATPLDSLTPESIDDFLERFKSVFDTDKRAFLGGWKVEDEKSPDFGKFVLDVSYVVDNYEDAVFLAKKGEQDGIFHIDEPDKDKRYTRTDSYSTEEQEGSLLDEGRRTELGRIQENLRRIVQESRDAFRTDNTGEQPTDGRSPAISEGPVREENRLAVGTSEFKKWFGDSKVIDDEGKPLKVYHGTPTKESIQKFKVPAYFTNDPTFAEGYIGNKSGSIYPVYLHIENPYIIDSTKEGRHFEWDKDDVAGMKSEGYDGVIVKGDKGESDIYTVFDQNQIKSAIGNRGTFDPSESDIRFAVGTLSKQEALRVKLALRKDPSAGAMKEFKNKPIVLTHWSKESKLASTDPSKHGTGYAGAEKKSKDAHPELWLDKTYYGYGTYEAEAGLGRYRYEAQVDGNKVYDSWEDPLKLYPSAAETRKMGYYTQAAQGLIHDQRIMDAGFLGAASSPYQAVKMFKPVDVKALPASDQVSEQNRFAVQRITRTPWQSDVPTPMDKFTRIFTDRFVDTKKVISLLSALHGQLRDDLNIARMQELYSSKLKNKVDTFDEKEYKPFLKKIDREKVTIDELHTYAHNRHAEEANNYIATLNIDPKTGIPRYPDGGSGIMTADARQYLAGLSSAQKIKYDRLMVDFDKIAKENVKVLLDGELITQDTADKWTSTYQYYAPLFREDMEGGIGTGMGFSVVGPPSKGRKGSEREVSNVIGSIARQREKYLTLVEKNKIDKALVSLVEQFPNPDFWRLARPGIIERTIVDTGTREKVLDPTYVSRKNVTMARIPDPKTGEIIARGVEFNTDDERAMEMVKALKNLALDDLGYVLGNTAKVTRYIASMNTQWNPIFGITNFVRDFQFAMITLSKTKLAGKQADIMKNVTPSIMAIRRGIKASKTGVPDTSAMGSLWKEAKEHGLPTGYRDLFRTSTDKMKAVDREMRLLSAGKILKGGYAIKNMVEDFNLVSENAVRLAVYRVAKESGLSPDQAASIGKNITVNFDRKGQISQHMGALFAFFNASAQGITQVAETLNTRTGYKIIAGGILLGSLQALLLAASGLGEGEPPEWEQEKNFIYPLGGGKYGKIPMPLGFNVLPGIGRITTQFILSGGKDPIKNIGNLMATFIENFNPLGGSGLSFQTVVPTVLKPFASLAQNLDWTGKPIYRPDWSSLDPTPGFTRSKDTASVFGKGLAWTLNKISGGDQDVPGMFSPTPDQIDYLVGQLTGGVGREAGKITMAAQTAITGEDLPTYKMPLVSRFFGNTEGQAQQATKFYDNIKKMNIHERSIKGRMERRENVREYIEDHPEARLFRMANSVENSIRRLGERKREMKARDASPESIKTIDAAIADRMKRFNQMVAGEKE